MATLRCAIYTRVSTDQGLDQNFNSLDAQYEASSAYITSQAHAGWALIRSRYDDGGYSGGSTDRPNLQRLLQDVRDRKIDIIVVYKVDRLTRSLADFAKLVELFDAHDVSFVSVTQQFNTTTSMGRLTLNVLLSFAQFEREVTSERIRDKIAASKRKGIWVGGPLPLGYALKDGELHDCVRRHLRRVRLRMVEDGTRRSWPGVIDEEQLGDGHRGRAFNWTHRCLPRAVQSSQPPTQGDGCGELRRLYPAPSDRCRAASRNCRRDAGRLRQVCRRVSAGDGRSLCPCASSRSGAMRLRAVRPR